MFIVREQVQDREPTGAVAAHASTAFLREAGANGLVSLLRNLGDYVPHWEACLGDRMDAAMSSLMARIVCRWRGVELGPGCQFWGVPIFRRVPGTRIAISGRCQFRSGHTSNLIGINHPCVFSTLKRGATIQVGSGCGFSGTVIGAETYVELGDRVRCGANTVITDSDWHPTDPRAGKSCPVIIEDDVWLGLNVTVLKGVRIGAGALVGAGSVVTRNIPPGSIAAGNPASVLRCAADVLPNRGQCNDT